MDALVMYDSNTLPCTYPVYNRMREKLCAT